MSIIDGNIFRYTFTKDVEDVVTAPLMEAFTKEFLDADKEILPSGKIQIDMKVDDPDKIEVLTKAFDSMFSRVFTKPESINMN